METDRDMAGTIQQHHDQADSIIVSLDNLIMDHLGGIEEDVEDESLTIAHARRMITEYQERNARGDLGKMSIGQKHRWIGWIQAICVLHKYAVLSDFSEMNYYAWSVTGAKADQHPVQHVSAAAEDAG